MNRLLIITIACLLLLHGTVANPSRGVSKLKAWLEKNSPYYNPIPPGAPGFHMHDAAPASAPYSPPAHYTPPTSAPAPAPAPHACTLDCIIGDTCVIDSAGEAQCVPSSPAPAPAPAPAPHACNLDCIIGDVCIINSAGQPQCVPRAGPAPAPHACNLDCIIGDHCIINSAGQPQCVPIAPACNLDCIIGDRCIINHHGRPECVPDNSFGPPPMPRGNDNGWEGDDNSQNGRPVTQPAPAPAPYTPPPAGAP